MAREATTFRLGESTFVAAEPPVVERFLLDSGCYPAWRSVSLSDVQISTPVLQLGTWIELRGRYGPRRFHDIKVVSGHVPGQKLSLRTTRGVIDQLIDILWAPADGGTRVALDVQGRLSAGHPWTAPLARAAVARAAGKDLRLLKHLLESGQYRFTVPSPLTAHPPRCTESPPPVFF